MMKWLVFLVGVGIAMAVVLSSILSALDPNSAPEVSHEYKRQPRLKKDWPSMDGSNKKLFWIVQISDIHISAYYDPSRGPDLEKFCKEYLPVIDPKLVVATGDLTDAKLVNNIESKQMESEWILYSNIVKRCRTLAKAEWLDVRGNHDSFDVFNFDSENNYYRFYSAHGPALSKDHHFERAYYHTLNLPFGSYSFVGFDACSKPGPNRPFNFFGYLDDSQVQHLRGLELSTRKSNHTVWFGHFPTSLIVHDPPVLRSIMRRSIAYLCGHLHTLGDTVPQMYSKHKTGQLELELGDWKENRKFRVMAFDHDLMSFTDAQLGDWPLVVVLNPKDSQFLSAENEPVELIERSSHVKVLVFSPDPVSVVEVTVDGRLLGEASQEDGPLYTLAWTPQQYAHGLHDLRVVVKDARGRTKRVEQTFSLDGSQMPFKFLPRLLLMLNLYSVGKLIYGLMAFLFTLILTSLRQCSNIRTFYFQGRNFICQFLNSWLMKMWLAARTNPSYYIVTGSVLYLTFGPWFVGDLLRGRTGLVFVWGMIVQGAFIPGGITYFYGIFQLLSFSLPLVTLLGHLLDTRRKHGNRVTARHVFTIFLPFILLLFLTLYIGFKEFPSAYGMYALLFGPLRTGNIFLLVLSVYLCYKTELKHVLAINGVH
ncbi:transmembrane protein 62 [Aplysia californica]|uniref:Transmembrane protein 62 n=1 Tax=Aplysia californica TaxID=6500 RepID=A0ABM0JAJ1_APLCA|nr:transmembrane protein 62 [Aplysia californica]